MAMAAADVSAISQTATIAAVLVPTLSGSPTQHIIGRWEDGGEAWRIFYDGSESPPTLVYQTMYDGMTFDSVTYELNPTDSTILFVFRRTWNVAQQMTGYEMWINRRLTEGAGSIGDDPDVGSGKLTIVARYDGTDWTDSFDGQINQVALYGVFIDGARLSLLLHTVAYRTGTTLGTPVPETEEFQTQPYPASNAAMQRPVLGRKPLAQINSLRAPSIFSCRAR